MVSECCSFQRQLLADSLGKKAEILILRISFWLTVSAKSKDSASQNQLVADSLGKKLRSCFSGPALGLQFQQEAKILLLRTSL